MSGHDLSPVNHFVHPDVCRVTDRRVPQFRMTYNYYNQTGYPITVATRNDLKVEIASQSEFTDHRFIIELEFCFTNEARDHFEMFISRLGETDNQTLDAIRTAYMEQVAGTQRYHNHGAVFKLEYSVTREQIAKAGGVMYIPDLDIIVSMKTYEDTPPHPYSDTGKRLGMVIDAEDSLDDHGFGFMVHVVDNAKRFDKLYMNVNRMVYPLVPVEDSSLRDGVYVVAPHTTEDIVIQGGRRCLYYPFNFDRLKEISVYRTMAEAESLGDDVTQRKAALAELEHATSVIKFEMQEQRTKHEKEMQSLNAELERRTLRLKTVEQELEMQRLVKKDTYEERSQTRKDSGEVLKILPAIIIGVGAALAAIKKIFS